MHEIPLTIILKNILMQLADCHVLGKDSLKYGNALAALEQVIVEEEKNENNIQ